MSLPEYQECYLLFPEYFFNHSASAQAFFFEALAQTSVLVGTLLGAR